MLQSDKGKIVIKGNTLVLMTGKLSELTGIDVKDPKALVDIIEKVFGGVE